MASVNPHPTVQRFLLEDLLKHVSRSFYLTLSVLPHAMRKPIGLAYLFARAADTIADTDLIDRYLRLQLLKMFRAQFAGDQLDWFDVRAIQEAVAPHQVESSERTLLNRLEDCFRLYLALEAGDRTRIRQLMGTLPDGMEMDLTVFPGDTVNDLTALQTVADLDRYTYYVAGCVGEFWTKMSHAHLPSLAKWDVTQMGMIGVRFGKGLQLTNVLKDMARDFQRGRCYIPLSLLNEVGLKPTDLLRSESRRALQPILTRLIGVARDHLDQGWLYTMAIPRREVRLRLACMWPILFAGETLRLVAASPDLLDPLVNVKISKRQVYRIMALTTLTGGCGYVGTAYWGRLRKFL
ncbi:MAG TPA: phytoene/squalene synthase family protein [Nitrospiraceae bacterium]|nr:phytoene/squalene synthase family protein [Nitrospiraceae bacterium]